MQDNFQGTNPNEDQLPLAVNVVAQTPPEVAQATLPPRRKQVVMKVFGVGGAGCNILEQIAAAVAQDVECVAFNTDGAALEKCTVTRRFPLGVRLTRGMGAGGDPDRGRSAAEEDAEKIRSLCQGVDMVFVVAGLGGGTGTGAGPVVARIARECGALVLGMVVLPFDWEGQRRQRQAQLGLFHLKSAADSVFVLPNQKLRNMVNDKTAVMDGFAKGNELITRSLQGIWRLLTQPGRINVDFADVCSVTRERHSEFFMAVAEGAGENRVKDALDYLQKHPLMENGRILSDSFAVLVGIVAGDDFSLNEMDGLMEQVHRMCDNSHIYMGTTIDAAFNGRLAVTFLASGPPSTQAKAPAQVVPEKPQEIKPVVVEDHILPQDDEPSRSTAKITVPGPILTPENVDEMVRGRSARERKKASKWVQESLQLDTLSSTRFENSERTIRSGQDLDVPTYLRRNMVFN